MERVLEFEKIRDYCLFGEKITEDDLIDEFAVYHVKSKNSLSNVVTMIILYDKVTKKMHEVFTTKDIKRYETEIDEAKRRDRIAIYRIFDVKYNDYRAIMTYVGSEQNATEHAMNQIKSKYYQSFEEIK